MARANGRAFSLLAENRMFSFAAFFTARATLCVIWSPCDETWTRCSGVEFNHWLWTSISGARICKRCSVNQTSFHIPTVYSHFSLIFPRFLACSVRCGAFIKCGGDLVTDLQAVRYRTRANWIRPEPDSVLRSVRSLTDTATDMQDTEGEVAGQSKWWLTDWWRWVLRSCCIRA